MLTVKFWNGFKCPVVGLGTYQSRNDECYNAVKRAIDVGYRHVDTALYYQNEIEIGRALKEKINEGVITREEIFLTSKLWNTFHRPDLVEQAVRRTLADLQTDYLDLYLIHWPTAFKDGWELSPKDEEGKIIYGDTDFLDTWKAMEQLVDLRLVKSIGLSNFNKNQISKVLGSARIRPANNQIEVHPYLTQKHLVDYCISNDITITAYRPIGGPPSNPQSPIHDPIIAEIGRKLGKSPGQIMIKFLIQRGIVAVPKSSNFERMSANLDVFDFQLDDNDMKMIMSLDKGRAGRLVTYDVALAHGDYPFNDEF